MAIATIQEAIDRGYLSASYIGNANAKGALFGGKIGAPGSIVTVSMITDALSWGYTGGAQTDADLREVANYLIWLIGIYGQQAQASISGGGSVTPILPPESTIYPFVITSADFTDSNTYNDTRIAGDNLILFINEYSQQWLTASGNFTYLPAGGFTIIIPGFDANQYDYTIVVQKLGS